MITASKKYELETIIAEIYKILLHFLTSVNGCIAQDRTGNKINFSLSIHGFIWNFEKRISKIKSSFVHK